MLQFNLCVFEASKMKTLIILSVVIALAVAYPGGLGGGYGGGYEGGHGGGSGGGDKATQIIHGGPVVTGHFQNPGLGYFNNYAPKIEGPLVPRGIGPHVQSGGKGGYGGKGW
ncbi:uncharacterized protein LOC126738826 [Anthonomus grandis grandis]|uniref:uncharacterized protein LOC126738826 n=1 Tax=Anthonomus grandis grandis TaxID=2921223 RepID=UPI0021654483|nr:uncharacterized protein LOC126738826 [Anthonomus grandis grandis]